MSTKIQLENVELEITDHAVYLHQNGISILRIGVRQDSIIEVHKSDEHIQPWIDVTHPKQLFVQIPR